jgi:16S rRNA (guanine966-N2)-methyltransferase
MRIIAGEYRSRRLEAPRGMATRPTSDKLRETLFNVLGPRIAGTRFADLYAGSGAVGLEAISRGAEFVWFGENARPALAAIRDNLRALKIAGGYAVEDRGVQRLLESLVKKGTALDVVFLDPPYEAEREYQETLAYLGRHAATLLREDAVVIAEHARKTPLAERYSLLATTRVLEQGDAALSFYSVAARDESGDVVSS